MKTVDTAVDLPGVCALTGTSQGPFVQLERGLGTELAYGGTAYVSVQALEALAHHIGYVSRGALEDAEAELAEVKAALEHVKAEHTDLLASVGTTLQGGAVVNKGHIALRRPYDRTAKRRTA